MNGRQVNMVLKRLWEIESRAVEIAKLIQPEIEPAILQGNLKPNLVMSSLMIIEKETNRMLNIFEEMDK